MNDLIKKIDNILPQTQCTKCGYKSCLEYAEAIAKGQPHNQCPPGGKSGIKKLSIILNREELTLNPKNGTEQPKKVAVINEDLCIGCKKCILACPVDAIIGTKKQMHTVINNECSGCELCITPCPMDCIDMIQDKHNTLNSEYYKNRYNMREKRLALAKNNKKSADSQTISRQAKSNKAAYIQDVLEKARKNKWNKSE